jgi:hypothetical protein
VLLSFIVVVDVVALLEDVLPPGRIRIVKSDAPRYEDDAEDDEETVDNGELTPKELADD